MTKKRCEDCVNYYASMTFIMKLIGCYATIRKPFTSFPNADDCLAYKRKWWKWWRPK